MEMWALSLMVAVSLASVCTTHGQVAKDLRDIVGVTHVAGKYHPTDKDFLNEGADQTLALGSRVIKVWFYCNELKDLNAVVPVQSNDVVCGFWLIRPDGTKAWTWDYFHDLFASAKADPAISR
jgi:hypothetical protein